MMRTSALPTFFFYDWSTWQRKPCFFLFLSILLNLLFICLSGPGALCFVYPTWRNVSNPCRLQASSFIGHFWLGLASCVPFLQDLPLPLENTCPPHCSDMYNAHCTLDSMREWLECVVFQGQTLERWGVIILSTCVRNSWKSIRRVVVCPGWITQLDENLNRWNKDSLRATLREVSRDES